MVPGWWGAAYWLYGAVGAAPLKGVRAHYWEATPAGDGGSAAHGRGGGRGARGQTETLGREGGAGYCRHCTGRKSSRACGSPGALGARREVLGSERRRSAARPWSPGFLRGGDVRNWCHRCHLQWAPYGSQLPQDATCLAGWLVGGSCARGMAVRLKGCEGSRCFGGTSEAGSGRGRRAGRASSANDKGGPRWQPVRASVDGASMHLPYEGSFQDLLVTLIPCEPLSRFQDRAGEQWRRRAPKHPRQVQRGGGKRELGTGT